MKKVYCLYRVSDRGQVEKNDIPMQKIACHAFADCHGWTIEKEFSEKGVSGYKQHMDDRDAIVQIKEDAKLEKFDILLVFMFDRIGRRDDETPFVVEWLVKQGIAVWSVCEGEQRFDNHVDKLTNYIRYWQAAGESERISERTRTRIRQLTEEGLFTGGVCPYGYQLVRQGRENKRKQPLYDLVIHPKEAETVRLIFTKITEGYGVYRMAKLLNEQGHWPKSGKPWSAVSLYGILRNPLYTGTLRKGGVSSHQERLQIVSQELFDEVQRLRENVGTPALRTRGALLSGLLYCGACGARMASNHVNRRYVRKDGTIREWSVRRYYCPNRDGECTGQRTYVAEKVEQIFLDQLSQRLSLLKEHSPEELAVRKHSGLIAEIKNERRTATTRKMQLEQEIKLLKAETVACLKGQSKFTSAQISAILAETETEQRAVTESICALEAHKIAVSQAVKEIETKIRKYHTLWNEYETAVLGRKKVILAHFVQSIEVLKDYQVGIKKSVFQNC